MANDFEAKAAERLKSWGTGEILRQAWPSLIAKPQGIEVMAKIERLSASPGAIKALTLLNAEIDVRPILLHPDSDPRDASDGGPSGADRGWPRARAPDTGRQIRRICRQKITCFGPAMSRNFWAISKSSSPEAAIAHRRRSNAFSPPCCSPTSSTSTRSAAAMGDHAWRRLLDNHDQIARQTVEKFRGNLVKTTGDGILHDLRRSRPRGPLRAGVQRGCGANRIAASGRPGTRARSNCGIATSAALPFTPPPASWRRRRPVKSWSRGS